MKIFAVMRKGRAMVDDTISRQAAINYLKKRLMQTALNNIGIMTSADNLYRDMSENRIDVWLNEMPTVDAVEVIRCGQCKYQDKGENEIGSWNCCTIGYCNVEDDYFCWWAERRQDD